MRKTLRIAATFSGVGLHGGQPVQITVSPAQVYTGIVFNRTDVAPQTGRIPARYDLVSDTRLCTRLTNEHAVSVGTVEHIMAALAGCGITDAVVHLNGPEVPIMDGSSDLFVQAFLEAGITVISKTCRAIRVNAPVEVERDGKRAALLPASQFEMAFSISFADPAIGDQSKTMTLSGDAFVRELAECRTFGNLAEVEQLRQMGLARGGSLDNAIVIDRGRVLNSEGLRHADEFVRHKMLDAIGDLALAGAPIVARYEGERAGHEMTNLLLRALFADRSAWSWGALRPGQCLAAPHQFSQPVDHPTPIAV